mgnify:CR=1 FL=1
MSLKSLHTLFRMVIAAAVTAVVSCTPDWKDEMTPVTSGSQISGSSDRDINTDTRKVLLLYSAGFNSISSYLKEDIEDLANYFIQIYQSPGEKYTLSIDALRKLQEYDWPGNIRELENVIQRALCFTNSGTLRPEDIQIGAGRSISDVVNAPNPIKKEGDTELSYDAFRQMQQNQEREFLIETIRSCNGSVRVAAQKLGLFRTALYNRLSHLGVNIKDI